MIYDDFDQDLGNRRVEAKNIFNKFNQTTDEQPEERKQLLKQSIIFLVVSALLSMTSYNNNVQ